MTLMMPWCTTILLAVWSACLWWTPEAVGATPLALMRSWIQQAQLEAVACAVGALCPLPLYARWRWSRVTISCWLLPQQILMLLSAISCVQAILLQQYADGVVRPFAFLLTDQLPMVLFAVIHTITLLRYYRTGLRE